MYAMDDGRRIGRKARCRGGASVVAAGLGTTLLVRRTLRRRPTIRPDRHGDPDLADRVRRGVGRGDRLAAAVVDLGADTPVRWAGWGADEETPFEIGSVTKGLNGVVFGELASRGIINPDTRVGEYIPFAGNASELTVRSLLTHRSGLPRLGGTPLDLVRGTWRVRRGENPYRPDDNVIRLAASAAIRPNRVGYSNLGAALAGHVMAAACDTTYEDLVRTEIIGRYGLTGTDIQVRDRPLVEPGLRANGRPCEPWTLGSYAPAGGIVSTITDVARLATAFLERDSDAFHEKARISRMGIGWHWMIMSRRGRRLVWHNGETGGYRAMFIMDMSERRAAIILASSRAGRVDRTAFGMVAGA